MGESEEDPFPTDRDAPPQSNWQMLREMRSDLKRILAAQESMHATLFGKEQQVGLVARVIVLEEKFKDLRSFVHKIGWVLAAAAFGLIWAIVTGRVTLNWAP